MVNSWYEGKVVFVIVEMQVDGISSKQRGGRGNSSYIMKSVGLALRYSASSAQIVRVRKGLKMRVKAIEGAK